MFFKEKPKWFGNFFFELLVFFLFFFFRFLKKGPHYKIRFFVWVHVYTRAYRIFLQLSHVISLYNRVTPYSCRYFQPIQNLKPLFSFLTNLNPLLLGPQFLVYFNNSIYYSLFVHFVTKRFLLS